MFVHVIGKARRFVRFFWRGLAPLPKVISFIMIVGAGFPDNGLGLESPATFQSERTFGK